ncbi:SHS2 domain-containing protein [Methanolinea mesophila]|uniref:archease n=1 Tax=Methanolinea mesophila TaxID=547055 RepID=UPI001AEA9920|nr:archease [Methanolinea mesophila]MBP1929298.1 SHS2 domain-containing protein [Methanolinea mesophila]
MSYVELEHTADVKLRVEAGTLEELFSEAVRALMATMYGSVEPGTRAVSVEVHSADLEGLVHDLLSEALFLSDVEEVVFSSARLTIGKDSVSGILLGEPFDPSRHRGGSEVKGISYSGMKIGKEDDTYILDVILDV